MTRAGMSYQNIYGIQLSQVSLIFSIFFIFFLIAKILSRAGQTVSGTTSAVKMSSSLQQTEQLQSPGLSPVTPIHRSSGMVTPKTKGKFYLFFSIKYFFIFSLLT